MNLITRIWRNHKWMTLSVITLLVLISALLSSLLNHEYVLNIKSLKEGQSLPDGFFLYQKLDEKGIKIKSIESKDDSLVIELDSREDCEAAQAVLQTILLRTYSISLSANISAAEQQGNIRISSQRHLNPPSLAKVESSDDEPRLLSLHFLF